MKNETPNTFLLLLFLWLVFLVLIIYHRSCVVGSVCSRQNHQNKSRDEQKLDDNEIDAIELKKDKKKDKENKVEKSESKKSPDTKDNEEGQREEGDDDEDGYHDIDLFVDGNEQEHNNNNSSESNGIAAKVERFFYFSYTPWLFTNRWSILILFGLAFVGIIYGSTKLESASRGDRYFPDEHNIRMMQDLLDSAFRDADGDG